jgi:hypothetical protein
MISSVHSPGSLVLIDHNGFTRGKVAKPTLLNLSLSSTIVKSVLVASRIPPLSLVCRASLDQNRDRSRSRNVDAREECFRTSDYHTIVLRKLLEDWFLLVCQLHHCNIYLYSVDLSEAFVLNLYYSEPRQFNNFISSINTNRS